MTYGVISYIIYVRLRGAKETKTLTKGNKMKPFLTIDEKSRLELSDLDNKNNKPIIFDINADYDGSVKSFAEFLSFNGIESVTTSSTSSYILCFSLSLSFRHVCT